MCVCVCATVDGRIDVLVGDLVETDNAAIERLVEMEVLPLRAFHVRNVDSIVVGRTVLASLCT